MESTSGRGGDRPTRLEGGIFLSSFAVLLIELLLTRIFSVVMFHHLSFLAVSLAMMGLGLGGLVVHLAPGTFRLDNVASATSRWAAVLAAGTVAAGAVAFHSPIDMEPSAGNWGKVLAVLGACLVPFTAGGIIIAHLLSRHPRQANSLYGFDLVGAGFACLAFIPMTSGLGAPSALLFAAAVAAFAGFVLAGATAKHLRAACLAILAALVGAGAANLKLEYYDVAYTHGGRQRPAIVRRWNAFSRVEILGSPRDGERPRPPLSSGYSHTVRGRLARELHLVYDANALTQIPGFRGDLAEVEYLQYDVASAPYHARRQRTALVIGAGGGRDVLTALSSGVENVTGVEINGLTIDLLRGPFRDFVGGLYSGHPRVRIFHDDGRNFVRSTRERFDLIQASLVDTWAASSAGAFALVENSLYTVDAFTDYFSRLTPDGMVSFSRWYGQPPEEVLRVVVLGKEALRRRGIEDARRHLAVVRTRAELTGAPSLATVIFKLTPLTDGEGDKLRQWARRMRFAVEYLPPENGWLGSDPVLATIAGPRPEAFIAHARYDLSVVDDDRPFFFDRVPLLPWLMHRLGVRTIAAGAGRLTLGGQTLLIALVATGVCTTVLFFVPLVASRTARRREGERREGGEEPRPGEDRLTLGRALAWGLYFAGLGLGFIAIEIVLIQRLNLHLGNPAYALSVVMFTVLIASGLGSYMAGRHRRVLTPAAVLAAVVGLLALYGLSLSTILGLTLGAPPAQRIAVAVLTIAPLAFLMGMPFPTGLRLAALESGSMVSWAWAVNGGASVFGSVATVLLSMSFGFSRTFLVGTLVYAVALACVLWLAPVEPEAVETG
jgi:hypothetical protein